MREAPWGYTRCQAPHGHTWLPQEEPDALAFDPFDLVDDEDESAADSSSALEVITAQVTVYVPQHALLCLAARLYDLFG